MYDDMDSYFDLEKDRYGDDSYNPDLLTEYSVWDGCYDVDYCEI